MLNSPCKTPINSRPLLQPDPAELASYLRQKARTCEAAAAVAAGHIRASYLSEARWLRAYADHSDRCRT